MEQVPTELLNYLKNLNDNIAGLSSSIRGANKDKKPEPPKPPSVTDINKTTPDTKSSQGKEHLRQAGDLLGHGLKRSLASLFESLSTKDNDKGTDDVNKSLLEKLSISADAQRGIKTAIEDSNKKPSAEEVLTEEKKVVKAPTKMIITDFEPKSLKKFSGIFSKMSSLFGGKSKGDDDVKTKKKGMIQTAIDAAGGFFDGVVETAMTDMLAGQLGDMVSGALKPFKKGFFKVFGLKDGLLGKSLGFAKNLVLGGVDIGKRGFSKVFGLKDGLLGKSLGFAKDMLLKSASIGKKGLSKVFGVKGGILGKFTGFAMDLLTNTALKMRGGLGKAFSFVPKIPGIGPGLASIASSAGGGILGAVKAAVPAGGKLLGMVGKMAKFAGPIGGIIAGGMAVFDGVSAATEEYKKSGSILAAAREGVAGALSGLTFGLVDQETFSGIMSSIGDGVGWVADGIASQFGSAWDGIKNLATGNISEGLGHVGSMLTFGLVDNETISGAIDSVSETFSKAGAWLSEGAGKVWDSITGFFTNSPDVWDVFDESGQKLSSGTQKVSASIAGVAGASADFEKSSNVLADNVKQTGDQMEVLAKDQQSALSASMQSAKQAMSDDIMHVHNMSPDILTSVDQPGNELVSTVKQLFTKSTQFYIDAQSKIPEVEVGSQSRIPVRDENSTSSADTAIPSEQSKLDNINTTAEAPDITITVPESDPPVVDATQTNEIVVPEIKSPEIPGVEIPEIKSPEIPSMEIPELSIPQSPDVIVPEIKPGIPEIKLPEIVSKQPDITIPEISIDQPPLNITPETQTGTDTVETPEVTSVQPNIDMQLSPGENNIKLLPDELPKNEQPQMNNDQLVSKLTELIVIAQSQLTAIRESTGQMSQSNAQLMTAMGKNRGNTVVSNNTSVVKQNQTTVDSSRNRYRNLANI